MNKSPNIPLVLFLAAALMTCGKAVVAQDTPGRRAESTMSAPAVAPPADPPRVKKDAHRFWDKTNDWLFAGVGAARTLDYFSTLNLRRRGLQEILITNDAVDTHAGFAAIEAAGTGVSMGASYLFHRYGHHKLERWTSIVHIGLATGGAVRNYSLKTPRRLASAPVP